MAGASFLRLMRFLAYATRSGKAIRPPLKLSSGSLPILGSRRLEAVQKGDSALRMRGSREDRALVIRENF